VCPRAHIAQSVLRYLLPFPDRECAYDPINCQSHNVVVDQLNPHTNVRLLSKPNDLFTRSTSQRKPDTLGSSPPPVPDHESLVRARGDEPPRIDTGGQLGHVGTQPLTQQLECRAGVRQGCVLRPTSPLHSSYIPAHDLRHVCQQRRLVQANSSLDKTRLLRGGPDWQRPVQVRMRILTTSGSCLSVWRATSLLV
jgi:hypothetical protein